jgi:hypothetical protein
MIAVVGTRPTLLLGDGERPNSDVDSEEREHPGYARYEARIVECPTKGARAARPGAVHLQLRRLEHERDDHRHQRDLNTTVQGVQTATTIASYPIGFTGDIARIASRPASPVSPAALPTTTPPRSNGPEAAGSCTAYPSEASGASTTPCTSPRSARSASQAQRVASTSNESSPTARPRRTPSALSSEPGRAPRSISVSSVAGFHPADRLFGPSHGRTQPATHA